MKIVLNDTSGSMIAMPMDAIFNQITWFKDIFAYEIYNEGWCFSMGYLKNGTRFYIKVMPIGSKITYVKAYAYAREYGFEIDEHGNVLSFDENKLTRNRHLLTGTELGLL